MIYYFIHIELQNKKYKYEAKVIEMLFAKIHYVCLDKSKYKNSSKMAISNKNLTLALEIQTLYRLEFNKVSKLRINQ